MKLSPGQIQQLFLFTEKKYVRYYDLQVELVDHLASRIEELMAENSKISFEQALQKVYSDFGIFGFAKVVQEKEGQVIKAGRRLLWKECRNFFRWPEITLIAFVAIITWQLTVWVKMEILFPAFCVAWFGTSVLFVINIARNIKRQKKKLLTIQFSPGYTNGTLFFLEWMYFSRNSHHNPWIFCIIVTAGVLFKLASYRAYKNIRKEAALLYPEAFAFS